jgi:hypothetical protein
MAAFARIDPTGARMEAPSAELAGCKYPAFISYSHKDERWALWLHKGIEGYRVPKPLVGRPGRNGPIPKQIFPVFRDRMNSRPRPIYRQCCAARSTSQPI